MAYSKEKLDSFFVSSWIICGFYKVPTLEKDMKSFRYLILCAVILGTATIAADEAPANPKIRIVNFKTCVEKSKVGIQEQAAFEALKKQMESVLNEKEKTLNDMATKFEDNDFLDSLSPDAETKLKREFRSLSQEFSQLQNQYMQALQQTNFKVIQKLTDMVSEASKTVAKQNNIDIILNDESCFYNNPAIDISLQVVSIIDKNFEKEQEAAKTPAK